MVLPGTDGRVLFPRVAFGGFLRKCAHHGQKLGGCSPVVTVQLSQIHKDSIAARDVDVVAVWLDAFQKRAVLLRVSVLAIKRKGKNMKTGHFFCAYNHNMDV